MIDSPAKRCSAIATRRLPWFRRFAPLADGTMDQGDRQQLAFVYRGVLAEEADLFIKYIIGGTFERANLGTFERAEIIGTFERLQ